MSFRDRINDICRPYSMISIERFLNNLDAVQDVEFSRIPGDIVEIGVWKGGSILSMMLMYEKTKMVERTFHLYDTFEGMTEPTELDKDLHNVAAKELLKSHVLVQAVGHLHVVQQNIQSHTSIVPKYHIGDILKNTYYPEKIAVLRLDTDWYESTKFELDNFYDKVVSGGYVIIDDYGHWKGCKQAVDEFLATHPEIKLTKIDYTGVFFRKP